MVTWDNQPVAGESYGSAVIPYLGAGLWYSFDVTELVRGWVGGSFPNEGLMVRGHETYESLKAWQQFYTRESSYVPYLLVTFSDEATAAASAAEPVEAGAGGPLLVAGCEDSGDGEMAINCSGE